MGYSNPLSSADTNRIAMKMEQCFQNTCFKLVLFIVMLGSGKGAVWADPIGCAGVSVSEALSSPQLGPWIPTSSHRPRPQSSTHIVLRL